MPSSPSIVPEIVRDVCLVLDDFGPPLGRAWRETDVHDANFETVIADLLEGQFTNPVRVIPSTRARARLTPRREPTSLDCTKKPCPERGHRTGLVRYVPIAERRARKLATPLARCLFTS